MRKLLFIILALPLVAAHPVPHVVQQEAIASQSAAAAASGTQEALTITVTDGTSFTATPNLWLKQSQVQTVGTIDQALAQLPKTVNHAVTINVGAGTYASATVSGFSGAGSITINGAFAVATGFTGTMSGTTTAASTQGSATSYGSIRQSPATWTANELRGKAFIEVDLSGTLYYRVIQATDTDDAYGYMFPSEPDSVAYRILENDSVVVTSLTVSQNTIPIAVNIMKVSDLTSSRNSSLSFTNVSFVSASNTSTYNRYESYTECIWDTSSASFSYGDHLYLGTGIALASNLTASYMRLITGEAHHAQSATTTPALTMTNVLQADMGFYATDCTFTPLSLNDVLQYDASGFGLIGASNTGTVGVAATGRVLMTYGTAPTLVGTSNFSANGITVSWPATTNGGWHSSTVSVYPSTVSGATTLTSNAAITATTALTASSTFLTTYGAVSGAGTAIGDATAASSASSVFITGGAANSGLLLPVPTVTPAKVQDYVNASGQTIKIYPSSGSTNIYLLGTGLLGVGTAYSLTDGKSLRVWPSSATTYYAVLVN